MVYQLCTAIKHVYIIIQGSLVEITNKRFSLKYQTLSINSLSREVGTLPHIYKTLIKHSSS